MREPLPADMFDELCPSSLNPIRIGDKWAPLIIRCLEHGPRRFSELRVPLKRVTPKVLTQSLRSLERDGLVRRTVYAEATPHVEYELTPLGRSLLEPLAAACVWTAEHWDELLDARESYDHAARLDPRPSPRTGATASRTPESPAA
ncbi:winged helix-turn-helix transcriptional regulator [Microbispora bryophytorum]|uniref:Transcriptional regulator n=1 Tax=Microbispora bryophytorum TaxID=1460882 RepID=A0A8H9LH27_9ACTN|nr:helix-turn-helix domain-containing protein [Microbispora bryophytorum]MBD3137104.1 helix-turn-helix transcriptional regulator [Microbispora bryophytorum]TQS07348.1 helix-turn-helix transcriptional regulator [Microbispora bryophytorum]GGO14476.1 transcriptional regulator [Microbispora bryophytorum]